MVKLIWKGYNLLERVMEEGYKLMGRVCLLLVLR
ncbi:hypothetical protein Goshw_014597 [Gossypium schwendimanii]|uniref:Uncharacterized protein n=1 Tax=Gossypium schwendimanii TaxID=34291 RepID=A0A7J9KL97_GOSSC|nr:hypothetical protein [Gossypium schwendimanii]